MYREESVRWFGKVVNMKKKAQLIGRCSEEIKKARKNSEEKVLKWKNYMQEAGKICIFGGGG